MKGWNALTVKLIYHTFLQSSTFEDSIQDLDHSSGGWHHICAVTWWFLLYYSCSNCSMSPVKSFKISQCCPDTIKPLEKDVSMFKSHPCYIKLTPSLLLVSSTQYIPVEREIQVSFHQSFELIRASHNHLSTIWTIGLIYIIHAIWGGCAHQQDSPYLLQLFVTPFQYFYMGI